MLPLGERIPRARVRHFMEFQRNLERTFRGMYFMNKILAQTLLDFLSIIVQLVF
jgi:hypothetical protein